MCVQYAGRKINFSWNVKHDIKCKPLQTPLKQPALLMLLPVPTPLSRILYGWYHWLNHFSNKANEGNINNMMKMAMDTSLYTAWVHVGCLSLHWDSSVKNSNFPSVEQTWHHRNSSVIVLRIPIYMINPVYI